MAQLETKRQIEDSLETQVYQRLLRAIVTLELLPEERLVESQLAAKLSVSRVPIRDALRHLESDQLVEISPRRGARVASLTVRDAIEVYTLRISLESLAAQLAAQNAGGNHIRALEAELDAADNAFARGDYSAVNQHSARFHGQIVVASDNRKLAILLQTIGHHVARLRTIQALSARKTTVSSAIQGHRAIFQAIAKRQEQRAERLMAEHIRIALDRVGPILAETSLETLKELVSSREASRESDLSLRSISTNGVAAHPVEESPGSVKSD